VQSFHMESVSAGDCAVLRVAGEVDLYTASELRQRVIGLIDDGILHLIADLRDVDFLDSTGLGALVGSLRRLRVREGSLELVTGGQILRILRLTGLTRVFPLHSSVGEAITADQHWQAAIAGQGDSTSDWCRKNGLA
jgi:anti-sigma B factor antagonist